MKTRIVFLCCCTLLIQQSIAQKCFTAKTFVVNTNVGIDGNFANQRYINGPEGTAQTLNGTAPASVYSLGMEYGLFNWLGIGAVGRLDNYFLQNDDVTPSTATAGAADIGATANIHLFKTTHVDIFAGYDLGFSHLMYSTNNNINTSSVANGSWSDIHATGRLYFGRLGINLCLYVPGTTYANFKASNTSIGNYTLDYWKSTGYGASVGLQYRLF